MKNGLFEENGELIYYRNGVPCHAGVIRENDDIYYIGSEGKAVKGRYTVHSSMANGILERGTYSFGDDYKLQKEGIGKTGLFREKGRLVYYRNGRPYHAGIIKEGDALYYISSGGYAVKGKHVVHGDMANGLLRHGTYTFGRDFKLIPNSFVPLKRDDEKKKNTKKKKKKTTLREQVFLVSIAAVVLILIFVVSVIWFRHTDRPGTSNSPSGGFEAVFPTFEEKVLLCSETAKSAYDGEITVKEAVAAAGAYKPFRFEYRLGEKDGMFLLSESPDMNDAKEYLLPAEETSISIDNLKTGTVYYYKIEAEGKTDRGFFQTEESTRFVNMPGVKNTRDIGGYTTLDGKKVKQGMLIRGTEIDGLVEPSYFLKNEAVDTVKETFGFVCDLDLRAASLFNGVYQSRFGKDVTHRFYNAPAYGSVFSAGCQPALRQIFSDLADPANYPMYLHCTYGDDRTGTVCFLLEGVLNLPEEVMQRDYQLTGYLISSYASSTSFNSLYGGVEGYEGDTVQERIVSYLTSPEVGVTVAEIESIRAIFLEP